MHNHLDTLEAQVQANKKRSIWAIIAFFGMINVIFVILVLVFGNFQDSNNPYQPLLWLGILEVILGLYIAIQYWQNGQNILRMNKGAEIGEDTANPDYKKVYNIVTEMSLAAGLPMPKVYIVPDPSPNAFATGMSPEKASVAVTQGLIDLMDREELEGVIGHEMSHIKNYDIRISTLSIALVGFITILGYGLLRIGQSMMYAFGGRRSSDSDRDSNYTQLIGIAMMAIGGLIIVLGIPLSYLLEKFVSRKREALADVSGAELTGNPMGLIKAFKKLEGPVPNAKVLSPNTSQLMLVEPLFGKEGKRSWWARMMDDHPPLDERIKNLELVLGEQGGTDEYDLN